MRIPSSANTAPAAGISAANSGHIACARSITAVVGGEGVRQHVRQARAARAANSVPTTTDQPIIRTDAARAPSGSPAPSIRPTSTCPAIAIASSTSARKMKSWNAIWCAPSDGAPTRASTAEATRNDASSARRAHRDLAADLHQRADAVEPRRLPARRARLHPHERAAHPGLGDHRAPRRAREPPVEAVDEQQLEHDVDRVRGDEDQQRRAQVRHPAQVALAGRGEHEERRAERRDPQVQHGAVEDLPLGAHQLRDRPREQEREQREHDADREPEPQRLRAERRRLLLAARRRAGARRARSSRR